MAKKDAALRIRLTKELRSSFLAACSAEDKVAAQVIREFMRDYVAERPNLGQQDLFMNRFDAGPLP